MTDDGFGALMCKKCVQSHRFGLGRGWVGGGDTIGGRGEPRSGIKNMYIGVCVCAVALLWAMEPIAGFV